MNLITRAMTFLGVLAAIAGAGRSLWAATPATSVTNLQVYQVKGVIKELPASGTNVLIRHEEIPGYMAAMTMEFRVAHTNELQGLAPGDKVEFKMMVTEDEGWIDGLIRIGKENVAPATTAPIKTLIYSPPLKVGEQMPDVTLTNEFGKAITLGQFRGQAVAMTFIFTRCPFPEFCPRMSKQFEQTALKLSALSNGPTNWHLLSISFDPENDTPAVLKRYAEFHQYNPGHWSFVTGAPVTIAELAQRCDLTIQRDGVSFNHNLRTVVLDTNGRIKNIFIGNEWTATELADELTAAAGVKPAAKKQ